MSVKPIIQVPVGNNVYYTPVNMTVNDWWVVAGNRNIEMRDVRSARIITTRYTVDWRKHLLTNLGFFAGSCGIFAIIDLLVNHRLTWGGYVGIGLIQVVRTLWTLRKKSIEHTLELTTTAGAFEVAKSNDDSYLRNITREICKRLARVAPTDVVKAVEEPGRSDLLVAVEPPTPSKPISYEWTGVTIKPAQVTVYHRVFPVEDILRAEVRSEILPMSFWTWVGFGTWIALLIAALFLPNFWILFILMLPLEVLRLGAFGTFQRGVQEWRRTHKYTVVMETRNEDIILKPTANLLLSRGMASNINSTVKQNLLGTPVPAPQLTSSVPTERV